jgi:hypothetical protein
MRSVAEVLADGTRNIDAAWLGKTLQARRNVDAVAVDLFVLDHHVVQVDPDAELHPASGGGSCAGQRPQKRRGYVLSGPGGVAASLFYAALLAGMIQIPDDARLIVSSHGATGPA